MEFIYIIPAALALFAFIVLQLYTPGLHNKRTGTVLTVIGVVSAVVSLVALIVLYFSKGNSVGLYKFPFSLVMLVVLILLIYGYRRRRKT